MTFLSFRNLGLNTSLKPNIRKFLVDGEYIPAHDVSYFIVEGVGGGGGGGERGDGWDTGGGGAYFKKIIKNPYGKYLIKIGKGGTQQTTHNADGRKGDDTTFTGKDVNCQAEGGDGGEQGNNFGGGGHGNKATGGNINLDGNGGENGYNFGNAQYMYSGRGGESKLGTVGHGFSRKGGQHAHHQESTFGSGGVGGIDINNIRIYPQAGADGLIIITEFIGKGGYRGLKGYQGAQGDRGIQGHAGVKGDRGSIGTIGEKGLQGGRGDKGNRGFQGAEGQQGIIGAQGVVGFHGSKGLQGGQGDKGNRGDQGNTGAQGIQGHKGEKGIQGHAGVKGNTGAQGIQGQQGAKGIKGDTGDKAKQKGVFNLYYFGARIEKSVILPISGSFHSVPGFIPTTNLRIKITKFVVSAQTDDVSKVSLWSNGVSHDTMELIIPGARPLTTYLYNQSYWRDIEIAHDEKFGIEIHGKINLKAVETYWEEV